MRSKGSRKDRKVEFIKKGPQKIISGLYEITFAHFA